MIAPILAALALMAIGFVPTQAAQTRRAAVIAGVIGLLIIPLSTLVLRSLPVSLEQMGNVLLGFFAIVIVGYGIFSGAIARYVIIGRLPMSDRRRWLTVAGAYVVFAALGAVGLIQVMSAL